MPPIRHDHLLALDQAIVRLETGWVDYHGDTEWFDAHPLPMPEFLRGMDVCGEPGRFIDLGCSMGTKMLVAYLLGWEVAGVEMYPDYAAAARRLVPEATIHTCDVRETPDLDTYDVVYSYRLCVDLDAQHELNRWIVDHMRPGALYFCAGSDPVGCSVEPVDEHAGVWRVI